MNIIELICFVGILAICWLGAKLLGTVMGVSPWWFFPVLVVGFFYGWYLFEKRWGGAD